MHKYRLKESLQEALATRLDETVPDFGSDTPAAKTLKLLDTLMHGEQVGTYCV